MCIYSPSPIPEDASMNNDSPFPLHVTSIEPSSHFFPRCCFPPAKEASTHHGPDLVVISTTWLDNSTRGYLLGRSSS